MSRDFADCKKEVFETLLSCLAYLSAEELHRKLMFKNTKNEDELIQKIQDTVRLFAPELLKEVEHEPA